MIDDTPVEPEHSYDGDEYDSTPHTTFPSTITSSSAISSNVESKRASKKVSSPRPRRPAAPKVTSISSSGTGAALKQTALSGGASLSSSSAASIESYKTSSKVLNEKLNRDADATLDFGTSDAPHAEGKKIQRPRANIWGMKLERRHGIDIYGCPAYKIIVQDEVRITMWAVLLAIVIVAIGFFIAKMVDNVSLLFFYNGYAHALAAAVAGVFASLACILTIVQIQAHKRHWVHPASQRHVVRILLMVPVYAVSAWLSLVFVKLSAYIDFIRGCYEAYVIWSFMLLLTEYLGGHTGVSAMMRVKLKQKWPAPMCCMPRAKPDSKFLWYLKYGALQYVIFSPIIAVLTIILSGIDAPSPILHEVTSTDPASGNVTTTVIGCYDLYCDGEFLYNRGFAYISFMQNATQILSLYTLAWLYLLMKQELKPYKPMPKFLVVKAVVFFTFWQGIALAALVKMHVLTATTNFDVGELEVGVQDFLVCIEMFIAAAVHKYTFGYETYVDGSFTILMEQRKQGNQINIPSGARVRIVHETSEGKTIWEPTRPAGMKDEEEEPQVLTLIVEEPEGVPPALFDDEQPNDIDANAGVDAPREEQSMAEVPRTVELEMTTQRPTDDNAEQGVDTLMDLVD